MSIETPSAELEVEQPVARLSEEERQRELDEAIERNEKLAESQFELARWFIDNQKSEFAVRRLKKILKDYPLSSYVAESRRMLKQIQNSEAV